jgi:D-alanyl-D-alanine carboxypeptidase
MATLVSCTTIASDGRAPGTPESTVEATVAVSSAPSEAPLATFEPISTARPLWTPGPTVRTTVATADAPVATPTTAPSTETPGLAAVTQAEATATAEPAGSTAPDVPGFDKKTTVKLDKILRNQVARERVAGLQAVVRLPSGEAWLGTAGKAEFSPDRPVEDDTEFAIASITKTFIAALIMQLAEEGSVDLDAPFGTYFADAPRKNTVTVRQLLSHTSGIYNFWENPRYGDVSSAWWERPNAGGLESREHEWTYEEMMGLVRDGYFKPGKDFHYSNTNYVILGKVAEAVAGQPLHKQLRQRFFKPLGMEHTVYQPAEKPPSDAAHGHWDWGGGYTDHTRDSDYVPFMAAVSVAGSAGAIASTAGDLSIWADALYGGKLLSAESLRQMTTFLTPGTYGLGTDVAVFAGHRGHGHRGGIRGYESSMWYFPDSGVTVVLLSNQGNWITDVPMGRLVKAVLGPA